MSKINTDNFNDVSFWNKIFEKLHTSHTDNLKSNVKAFDIENNRLDLYKTRLITEGYIQLPKLQWDHWFSEINPHVNSSVVKSL